jgi:hypothetical protein
MIAEVCSGARAAACVQGAIEDPHGIIWLRGRGGWGRHRSGM